MLVVFHPDCRSRHDFRGLGVTCFSCIGKENNYLILVQIHPIPSMYSGFALGHCNAVGWETREACPMADCKWRPSIGDSPAEEDGQTSGAFVNISIGSSASCSSNDIFSYQPNTGLAPWLVISAVVNVPSTGSTYLRRYDGCHPLETWHSKGAFLYVFFIAESFFFLFRWDKSLAGEVASKGFYEGYSGHKKIQANGDLALPYARHIQYVVSFVWQMASFSPD